MDRRKTLKTLVAGAVGGGLVMTGCKTEPQTSAAVSPSPSVNDLYGRLPEEIKRDAELQAKTFFNAHEMASLGILCDLIIPADEVSGSATQAKVPEFIEFMMKDQPHLQTDVRGALKWMDYRCLQDHGKTFKDCTAEQQTALLDKLAYPDEVPADCKSGVKGFNLIRNLTATGFFTTELGIKDLGYKGNQPNVWDGPPAEVMQKYGLSYDEKYLPLYVNQDLREQLISWDDAGNIVG